MAVFNHSQKVIFESPVSLAHFLALNPKRSQCSVSLFDLIVSEEKERSPSDTFYQILHFFDQSRCRCWGKVKGCSSGNIRRPGLSQGASVGPFLSSLGKTGGPQP